MKKLWHGRFSENQNQLFDAINKSITLDAKLFQYEIEASIAHAEALAAIDIYNQEEVTEVITTLLKIKKAIITNEVTPLEMDEDVHMWVERLLTEELGELGKRLHTARSRNDQVVTIVRLYLKDCYKEQLSKLHTLIETLCQLSTKHINTLLPACTHLQAAQPISLAFYLLNYANKLKRDYQKMQFFAENINYCPLGSGAVSGVNYAIDRNLTSKNLNFKAPIANALDAISDRDYIHDYLYINSLIHNHLSQLAEDFIIWNTAQFNFIQLSDRFASGSSIMPQKKNPDAFELIRAKAAAANGRLSAITTLTKGIPYSYNKDLQEDKVLIFNSFADMNLVLEILPPMLKTTQFNQNNMQKAVAQGFLNATDLADALVKKGLPFREAHQLIGKLVAIANKKNSSLEELSLDIYKREHSIFDNWVYQVLDYHNCLENKQSLGSTNPKFVKIQIEELENWLKNN